MELERLGSTPISESAPAGEDSRYEPEYAALLAEIEKLSSITAGSSISWPSVVKSAIFILQNKSKDLLVTCYLAVGLIETQGLSGLPTGLHLLTDFIMNYWETGFPVVKRLRGRVNALDWWRERISEYLLAACEGASLPSALYDTIDRELSALDTAVGMVMPDYMPLRDLQEALRRLPLEAAAPPIPDAPVSSPPDSPKPVINKTAFPNPVVDSTVNEVIPALTEDSSRLNAQFMDFAHKYAFAGHAVNPADPLPWQALRLAVWGKITVIPPSEGNTTFIPTPDMERKLFLEQQTASGNTQNLLTAALNAENIFPAAMFWLDLQRIIHTALKGLGNEYRAAANVVQASTSILLANFPELENKTFADGTPFADVETHTWLRTLDTSSSVAQSPPQNSVLEEADKRYLAGDLAGALGILDTALQSTVNGVERVPLRLAQCSCLCRSMQWAGATALADLLIEDIDRRNLESWDQQLVLTILLTAREAWEGFGGETGIARAFALNNRIHRLAPSRGLRFN